MAEYTPTTEEVATRFVGTARTPDHAFALGAAFDRFLAAREAEVRERIAQDIEAVDPIEWALAGQRAGEDAARIARGATR